MIDDNNFIKWLQSKGFQIQRQGGEGLFKSSTLVNNGLKIFIGHDAEIKNRHVSYFYLYDNEKVRKRTEPLDDGHFRHTVLMWELPTSEKDYQNAIDGKLTPVQ